MYFYICCQSGFIESILPNFYSGDECVNAKEGVYEEVVVINEGVVVVNEEVETVNEEVVVVNEKVIEVNVEEESIHIEEGVTIGDDNDSGGEERQVDVQWTFNEDFDVDDEL